MKHFLFSLFVLLFVSSGLYSQNLRNVQWTAYTPVDTIMMEFKSNDTLYVSNSDTSFAISTFSTNQDTIDILDISSFSTCGTSAHGTYRFSIANDTLLFSNVSDTCSDRIATISGLTWFTTNSVSLSELSKVISTSFYPMPLTNEATLQVGGYSSEAYSVAIYNLNGQLIRNYQNVNTRKLLIQKNNMPTGMYTYHLITSDGAITSGKFMVK